MAYPAETAHLYVPLRGTLARALSKCPTHTSPGAYKVTQATAANAPIPLADTEFLSKAVTLHGKKDFDTPNADEVKIRLGSPTGPIAFTILVNEPVALEVGDGNYFDLRQYYLDAQTNGDGVVVECTLQDGFSIHPDIAGA